MALHAVPLKRQIEASYIKSEIRKIYQDSKGRFGAPKIFGIFGMNSKR